MTGPRNFRTIIDGNFIRIEEQGGGKGVNIPLTVGLGGGAGEELCPQLAGGKRRGTPRQHPRAQGSAPLKTEEKG